MKNRLVLPAAVLSAVVLGLAGTASADVAPQDQSSARLTVVQHDAAGDQRVSPEGRQLPASVTRSIDLRRVRYHVDRTAEVLTITYRAHRILPSHGRYHQLFASIATVDKHVDDMAASAVFITTTRRPVVRVFGTSASGETFVRRCGAASVDVRRARGILAQRIPFSCFDEATDHGYLKSVAALEARNGADLAWDGTPYTRDVPLSPVG